jgi:hypothetical protein
VRQIFIDANYFIALNNSSSSLHRKAKRLISSIAEAQLYISDYIFLEVVTVFSQLLGREKAAILGHELLHSDRIRVLKVRRSHFQKSWEIFQEIDNKDMSFVDCSIIALMQDYDLEHLLTFDISDFGKLTETYNFNLVH